MNWHPGDETPMPDFAADVCDELQAEIARLTEALANSEQAKATAVTEAYERAAKAMDDYAQWCLDESETIIREWTGAEFSLYDNVSNRSHAREWREKALVFRDAAVEIRALTPKQDGEQR